MRIQAKHESDEFYGLENSKYIYGEVYEPHSVSNIVKETNKVNSEIPNFLHDFEHNEHYEFHPVNDYYSLNDHDGALAIGGPSNVGSSFSSKLERPVISNSEDKDDSMLDEHDTQDFLTDWKENKDEKMIVDVVNTTLTPTESNLLLNQEGPLPSDNNAINNKDPTDYTFEYFMHSYYEEFGQSNGESIAPLSPDYTEDHYGLNDLIQNLTKSINRIAKINVIFYKLIRYKTQFGADKLNYFCKIKGKGANNVNEFLHVKGRDNEKLEAMLIVAKVVIPNSIFHYFGP